MNKCITFLFIFILSYVIRRMGRVNFSPLKLGFIDFADMLIFPQSNKFCPWSYMYEE